MLRAIQGARGERSLLVRNFSEHIIGGLFPKDYLGEILAINYWVAKHVLYVNDPLHVELLKDPQRICEELMSNGGMAMGQTRGDCDDIATLIATLALCIGRKSQLVVAGFGEHGSYSHVFTRVLEPKSGAYIVCDPVAGSNVGSMLRRITTYQIWCCDELPTRGPIEVR
jgi:hypothetical protein